MPERQVRRQAGNDGLAVKYLNGAEQQQDSVVAAAGVSAAQRRGPRRASGPGVPCPRWRPCPGRVRGLPPATRISPAPTPNDHGRCSSRMSAAVRSLAGTGMPSAAPAAGMSGLRSTPPGVSAPSAAQPVSKLDRLSENLTGTRADGNILVHGRLYSPRCRGDRRTGRAEGAGCARGKRGHPAAGGRLGNRP